MPCACQQAHRRECRLQDPRAGGPGAVLRAPAPPPALRIALLIVFPLAFNLYMSLQAWFVSSTTPPHSWASRTSGDLRQGRPLLERHLGHAEVHGGRRLPGAGAGPGHRRVSAQGGTGRGVVRTVMLLPMVSTPVAVALIWVIMFNPSLGVLNYFLGLLGFPPLVWLGHPRTVLPSLIFMDIWKWTPFMVLIIHAGLQSFPPRPSRLPGSTAARDGNFSGSSRCRCSGRRSPCADLPDHGLAEDLRHDLRHDRGRPERCLRDPEHLCLPDGV